MNYVWDNSSILFFLFFCFLYIIYFMKKIKLQMYIIRILKF